MRKSIDELLEASYRIIDILPEQVPADTPGQFFAVERYFLKKENIAAIKQKHINLILKLNCYMAVSIDDEPELNPEPDYIAETMLKRYVYIRVGDAMILSEPDDTHMTIFNADKKLLNMLQSLASGEGLFVWQPPI